MRTALYQAYLQRTHRKTEIGRLYALLIHAQSIAEAVGCYLSLVAVQRHADINSQLIFCLSPDTPKV